MSETRPVLSVCIPTYNRADILDDCLEQLSCLDDWETPFEIVVSDNASADDTPKVVAAHARRNPRVRGVRMAENRGSTANRINAVFKARGDMVVCLADDDSLIPDSLAAHVARMRDEPDLSAIFTDWIAWDDAHRIELHRYFSLDAPTVFGPDDPMGLVNFVLLRMLPPEIGVFRRAPLLRAQSICVRAMPFHLWMYGLSRLGRIRFDPLPFYREHRVLKPGLARGHWANMDIQLAFIGDEQRLSLESLLLLALEDSGRSLATDEQRLSARQAIDRILHARTSLEIDRACARGDFILAVELRRRQVLWNGAGSHEDVQRDVHRLVLPAALQAIEQTFRSLSDVDGVRLKGFNGRLIADTLAQRYPTVPILGSEATDRAVIVHRDEHTLGMDASLSDPGAALVLERLVQVYRVAGDRIDVSGL